MTLNWESLKRSFIFDKVVTLIIVVAALALYDLFPHELSFTQSSISVSNSTSGIQPLKVEDGSRVALSVHLLSGRFTARLAGQQICDLSWPDTTTRTYFQLLTPGTSALEFTAWDHGNSKYDVRVEVTVSKLGRMETLAGPFSFVNPDAKASGRLYGISLYLESPKGGGQ